MFAWSSPTIVVVVLCVELPTGAEEAVSRQSQSEAISRDAARGSGEVRYTHRSTILTPQPWISYKGGGVWGVLGRKWQDAWEGRLFILQATIPSAKWKSEREWFSPR